MKILILSDNHSRVIDFDTSEYDIVIHCGDYGRCFNILDEDNILFVRGNCDLHGEDEIFYQLDNRVFGLPVDCRDSNSHEKYFHR